MEDLMYEDEEEDEVTPQEELLDALKNRDRMVVNTIAAELFLTHANQPNLTEIDAFEKYAPCKIIAIDKGPHGKWLIGGIRYSGTIFTFEA